VPCERWLRPLRLHRECGLGFDRRSGGSNNRHRDIVSIAAFPRPAVLTKPLLYCRLHPGR
jgi:hypothetical protein